MASAAAEPKTVSLVVADCVEVGNPAEAHDHLGHEQPLPRPDDERSAAGDNPGILAMLFEQLENLFQSIGFLVVEFDHCFKATGARQQATETAPIVFGLFRNSCLAPVA